MPQLQVKDANNATQTIGYYANTGQTTASASIPVTLASDQSAIPVQTGDSSISGAIAIGGTSSVLTLNGRAGIGIVVTGITGSCTLEGTIDGTTWVAISVAPLAGGARANSITASGSYEGIGAGVQAVRVNAAGSSTAVSFSLLSTRNSRIIRSWSTNAANFLASAWLSDGSGNAITSTSGALDVNLKSGGFATSALQTSGNASLASVDGKMPALLNGRQPITARNTRTVFRDQGISYTPNALWTETTKTGGALIFNDGNAAGAAYVVISLDPLDNTSAGTIEVPLSATMPIELVSAISLSQRTVGQEFSFELVSTVADPAAIPDVSIASIQQSASVLTVTTATAHGLRVGDQIGIRDVPDSRVNYASVVVATTPSTTQFTVTAGPGGTIPSVTAGPFATGYVYRRNPMNGNLNGTALVFENATATSGTFHVRGGELNAYPSGTIAGNQAVTIATSASVQAVNAAGNYAFQPTSDYRLIAEPQRLQWLDSAIDAVSTTTPRSTRTQICPDPTLNYRIRVRALNYAALSRPVAQIVSVAKTGTTTATVVTDVAHNLTTGDYINTYGVRDTANFANLTTATVVASVVNSTTFTVVWGTAVTATSYGGYVSRVNGGQVIQGALTMCAQSVSRTSNIVTVVGSASWSGAVIGDLVNLVGIRDATVGATVGIDGTYRIRDIQTTNLILEPIGSAPTGADIASVNCGGAAIKRTDIRLHYVKAFEFERERFEMVPRGATEAFAAIPTAVTNTPAVTISSGTVTTVTTVTTCSTVTAVTSANLGIPGTIADVASAALTTTTTTTAFTPTFGTSYQVNVPVTAVTGTSPTLDIGVEESDDAGTNWFRVYDFPRITATGMYRSPKLPLVGNRVRYVQTVGGTSPSFTRAVNRLQGSDDTASIRQIIDRSIVLTTLNSTTPSLNIQNSRNVQLVINIGAATTPPALQLEGSDDNGASWYALGSPLTGVASSSVQVTVTNVQAQLLRARVSTIGATVTAGYVLIKGF